MRLDSTMVEKEVLKVVKEREFVLHLSEDELNLLFQLFFNLGGGYVSDLYLTSDVKMNKNRDEIRALTEAIKKEIRRLR